MSTQTCPPLSRSAGHSVVPISKGLPPVAGPGCRILVLGSLPGAESLRLQQYYAHPRNHFWELMGTVCGFPSALPYPHRVRALLARDIAVWDVLASGHRPGSLDSAIDLESAEVNPFDVFLRDIPTLSRILFNGALAERLFAQRVLPGLPAGQQGIKRMRLPSTSPANASIPKQEKLVAWRAALELPK